MRDLRENIGSIIEQSYVLSFACVDGDQPYQVWMHYVGDLEKIIVYSRRDRVHSDIVRKHDKVSVAILPEQMPGYGVRGLSGQGTIRELVSDDEIAPLVDRYQQRYGPKDRLAEQVRSGKADEHAFWEIKMSNYVLFDYHNYPGDSRKEYEL